jgi:phosphoserine phosphatase
MVTSLSMVKDVTPQKFERVSEWMVEVNLWKKRREDVIARLKDQAGNGAQVYIASSVHQPGVAAFARRIGAQAIGSPVEFVDGRVRIAGDLVADEKKVEQVLVRLGVERVDFAYGDTILDLPLLEHAGHPVAVYPDEKLRAVAKARGWEIMGETTSYP